MSISIGIVGVEIAVHGEWHVAFRFGCWSISCRERQATVVMGCRENGWNGNVERHCVSRGVGEGVREHARSARWDGGMMGVHGGVCRANELIYVVCH